MKKYLLASLAVFITYAVLDFLIHGLMLRGMYEATASLWRPQEEMMRMMKVMYLATAVSSLTFTALYAFFVKGRSAMDGAKFGLVYGLGVGFSMGIGTYAMMPLPMGLAWAWFLSYTVEATLAGAVAGLLVKAPSA
jgi:hypothetical protein